MPDKKDGQVTGDKNEYDNENGVEKNDFVQIKGPCEEPFSGVARANRRAGKKNESEILCAAENDLTVYIMHGDGIESNAIGGEGSAGDAGQKFDFLDTELSKEPIISREDDVQTSFRRTGFIGSQNIRVVHDEPSATQKRGNEHCKFRYRGCPVKHG